MDMKSDPFLEQTGCIPSSSNICVMHSEDVDRRFSHVNLPHEFHRVFQRCRSIVDILGFERIL